ncbi:MAG: hypothetical protein ACJ8F7_08530, partial [Gemmataceae bacterium]
KYLDSDRRATYSTAQRQVESVAFSVKPKETITFRLTFEATTEGIANFQAQLSAEKKILETPITVTESTTITPATK